MKIAVNLNRIVLSLFLPVLALVYGCGGSSSSSDSTPATAVTPPPSTLSGTAATGLPIVSGNISVKCAAGSTLTTTTSTAGAWTVTISGQTMPCAVQVSGGTVGGVANTTPYHSVALAVGTVNVTPLTDMVVANMAGQSPATWFSSISATTLSQTATTTAVSTAVTNVQKALGSVSGMTAMSTTNPMTTAFKAQAGDSMDAMLDAMKTGIAAAKTTYADIVVVASKGSGASFTVTLPAAATVPAGGSSTGTGTGTGTGSGSTGGSTGTGTLVVSVSVSGAPATTVTINNTPKPASQANFCAGLTDANASTSLNKALGAAGTFTINSCTFDGTKGSISATLVITSPVSVTVPYTVTYTYS